MLQSFKLFLTLIMLLAAIGPVGILSSILVNKISEITTESAQKELQLVVQRIATEGKQRIELIMSGLQTLANNPDTVQATAKSPFGIKTSEAYRVAEAMQKLLSEHNIASSLFLTNESLEIMDAAPETLAEMDITPIRELLKYDVLAKETDKAFGFDSFKSQTFFKSLHEILETQNQRGELQSDHGIIYSLPITNATGDLKGTIIILIPVGKLAAMSVTKVLSGMQLGIAIKGKSALNSQHGLNTVDYLTKSTSIDLQGSTGKAVELSIQLMEPKAVRFAQVNETINNMILYLGITLLALVAFSLAISRWLISPLKLMTQTVNQFANGHYGYKNEATIPFNEFKSFGTVLTDMGDKILAQISEMQQHIHDLESMEKSSKEMSSKLERDALAASLHHAILNCIGEGKECLIYFRNTGDSLIHYKSNRILGEEISFPKEGRIEKLPQKDGFEIAPLVDTKTHFIEGIIYYSSFLNEEERKKKTPFIANLANTATMTLDNIRHVEAIAESSKLEAEMEATRMVQEALMPNELDLPKVDIYSSMVAADSAGGDWFGVHYDKSQNTAFFYIGDVTGHGIPSSIVTGVVCGAVYSSEMRTELMTNGKYLDPEQRLIDTAKVVNQIVLDTGSRCQRLMTMAFISIKLDTGEVHYLSAGHNPIYWLKLEERTVKTMPNRGNRLGYNAAPEFKVRQFTLNPGDGLFLYTDGLIENTGPDGTLLSEKRLKDILKVCEEIDTVQSSVYEAANRIWKEHPADDDVTTLVFNWEGPVTAQEVAEHQKRIANHRKKNSVDEDETPLQQAS